MTSPTLTEADRTFLAELEDLVRQTYQLWDENWVGFSWRNYTYDHVMRVRNLARTIAAREGADLRALEFAATLHDITKSFDGEILMRDGKRVLDPEGFWLNEKLPPARQNRVTDLYDRLNLTGTVHHISGGHIAAELLAERGYEPELREAVREIIHAHLKPGLDSSVAGLSLYDADTIDANIGLPAFYRNIRISVHRMEDDYARKGEDLDAYFAANLRAYLTGYLGERIPTWINGKRDDFIARLTTEAGREVARARIAYLSDEVQAMADELAAYEDNLRRGRLAVVRRFIENRANPSLTCELGYLRDEWAPSASATPGAVALIERYQREINGEA
jgi:hypothetical protein